MIIRFIEPFAGIGGIRNGLEKANDTITERTQQRIRQRGKNNPSNIKPFLGKKQFNCVWANEIDKYACQVYRKNYGKKEMHEGDIRGFPAEAIPDHKLLTAGFPCQSFSIAGKRKGFKDTRGIMFFEICRIAKVKSPRLILLENVKGLLNHEGGSTFRTILTSLSELGYDCEWEVLNSKNFGVPQNRERVFIVGHLRGTGGGKVFPIGETDKIYTKSNEKVSHAIDSNYHKGWLNNQQRTMVRVGNVNPSRKGQSGNVVSDKGISFTISAGGGNPNRFPPRDIGYSMGNILTDTKIRRLTPTECERLQGFPDGWTEGISDTQRYKCLGNAVTTNVITEIGKRILKILE